MATHDEIRTWFADNPNASDQQIYDAMQQNGVSTSTLAGAMNFNRREVQDRYDAINGQSGNKPPVTINQDFSIKPLNDTMLNPFEASKTSSGILGSAQGYSAATSSTNNALTSDRLNELLASDSPYLKRARDISSQQSNSRGLLNSSMAAGAGTASAIDAAMPIATQDSQTIMSSRLANQNAANQANQFQATENNTNNRMQFEMDANTSQFNANASNAFKEMDFNNRAQTQQYNAELAANVAQFNAGQMNEFLTNEMQRANDVAIQTMGFQSNTVNGLFDSYMDSMWRIQTFDFGEDNPEAKANALRDLANENTAALSTLESITGADNGMFTSYLNFDRYSTNPVTPVTVPDKPDPSNWDKFQGVADQSIVGGQIASSTKKAADKTIVGRLF